MDESMRKNIVIDNDLMNEALKVSRLKAKREAVEDFQIFPVRILIGL